MAKSFFQRKPIVITTIIGLVICALLTYFFADLLIEPSNPRLPASVQNNYESLNACEKQDILWKEVQATAYTEFPAYREFGLLQLLAMGKQEIGIKGRVHSDFAPAGWKKYLHGRGAIAKVKIVPKGNQYTGIFQGAECALLRLSLTYKTTWSRPVAPGLALKVLRDGTYSANISALVSLDGQAKDFNFFKNPMSNIVPIGNDWGQKKVHQIFQKASKYPEELLTEDMARMDSHGMIAKEVRASRQIFFVPGKQFKFPSEDHDVRDNFVSIPEETLIYKLYMVPASEKFQNFDYTNYTAKEASSFLQEAEYVADIVTTSKFIASEFGDDGIFFRHQLRP